MLRWPEVVVILLQALCDFDQRSKTNSLELLASLVDRMSELTRKVSCEESLDSFILQWRRWQDFNCVNSAAVWFGWPSLPKSTN